MKKEKPRNIKFGNVQVTIWLNEINGTPLESVTIQRSYKDANDQWQTSNSFNVNDLPKLIACLQRVYSERIKAE